MTQDRSDQRQSSSLPQIFSDILFERGMKHTFLLLPGLACSVVQPGVTLEDISSFLHTELSTIVCVQLKVACLPLDRQWGLGHTSIIALLNL